MLKAKTWQHEVTGTDGNVTLFGVNIFDYKWNRTGKYVTVNDPLYHQKHEFEVFTVNINDIEKEFAAGEFSNCVWGFYILKY